MLDRVRGTIVRHRLLSEEQRVLVAVSGGVDSMVLLAALHELGYDVVVGHVEHGLRGADSRADRDFVVERCREMGIACLVRHLDPSTYDERAGISVQMAAREGRLQALQEMAAEAGAAVIATAHHADDALETLLLNLMRGTGARGWGSIPVSGNGFIRPLIEVSRAEITAYARARGIVFREDGSNQDPKYLRNRVRHELLPLMEAMRPGAGAAARRSAMILRELAAVASAALQADLGEPLRPGGRIALTRLLATDHPRLALLWVLREQAPHPDVIEDVLQAIVCGRHGARFEIGGATLWVERDHLLLSGPEVALAETIVPDDQHHAGVPLRFRRRSGDHRAETGAACFDAAHVSFPMVLREWRAGDRMRPVGMSGSKLVSDILTDDKVDHSARAHALVLESGGRIIWLIGHRLDASAVATPATREVLEVECTR